MVGMGYSREEINESLTRMKYDEITATYLLLGRKSTEVSLLLMHTNVKDGLMLTGFYYWEEWEHWSFLKGTNLMHDRMFSIANTFYFI